MSDNTEEVAVLTPEGAEHIVEALLNAVKPDHKAALEANRNSLAALAIATTNPAFTALNAAMKRNATHGEVIKEVAAIVKEVADKTGFTLADEFLSVTCELFAMLYIRAFIARMKQSEKPEQAEDTNEYSQAAKLMTDRLTAITDMKAAMAEAAAAKEQIAAAIDGIAFIQCARLAEQYFVFETITAMPFLTGIAEVFEKAVTEALPSLSADARSAATVLFTSGFGVCVRDYLEDITSDKMIFNSFIRSKLPHSGFNVEAAMKAAHGPVKEAAAEVTTE